MIQSEESEERGDIGMPIKLDGMSEVTRNMEQLKKVFDGAFAGLSFDPQKPEEVARAIREIEMKVDLKMAPYISSPGVREISAGLKASPISPISLFRFLNRRRRLACALESTTCHCA